jgi:hypothetical protein
MYTHRQTPTFVKTYSIHEDTVPSSFEEVDQNFRGAYCLCHQGMMEAVSIFEMTLLLRDYKVKYLRRLSSSLLPPQEAEI